MQPKQLIYTQCHHRVLNYWEINIKYVCSCKEYGPGMNLRLQKRQECTTSGTTNELIKEEDVQENKGHPQGMQQKKGEADPEERGEQGSDMELHETHEGISMEAEQRR